MRANAVVVPLNPMLLEHELSFLLQDSGSKVVIAAEDLLPRVEAVKEQCSIDNSSKLQRLSAPKVHAPRS